MLLESIRTNGIISPIIVNAANVIVDGHLRVDPAPHAPLSQSDAIHKFVERLAKEAEREREWERKHGR